MTARAMVLAAGFGSRLGTLSDERPKPLIPIADVPVIRHGLAMIHAAGIRDVVVNLHHRGELIRAELGDGSGAGLRIAYSEEETILGTGGGIRRALPRLGEEPFVIVNGKIIIDLDLAALLASHRASGADATLVVYPDPDARRWGGIDAPPDGGPIRGLRVDGDFMFTGVHVLSPTLAATLPAGESCIVGDGYIPWVAAGRRIDAFVHRGYFMEHSTPERYLQGNLNVLRGLVSVPFPLGIDPSASIDPGATIHAPVRIGAHATISAGATIGPDTVIGHHAHVARDVTVARSVVWDGARVDRDADRAIVTASTRTDVGR